MSADSQYPNVQLETSAGTIVLELYWREAPKTCYNMSKLAEKGYYDGVPFHRVIKDFMIQGQRNNQQGTV